MAQPDRRPVPDKITRAPIYEPIVPRHSETFVWRCDDYPLPWCVWNSHTECEIHLIRNAQGTCYVGDYIGPFAAGELYLIGRNLPHNWVTPLGPGEMIEQRDVVVQFDQDRLIKAAEFLPELNRLSRLLKLAERGLKFQGEACARGTMLVEAIGKAAGLERLTLLFELLHLLATTVEVQILSSESFAPNLDAETNLILRNVLQHLAARLDDDIRLSDMAEIAGMTESSFSRFFKKNTGNTFTRHLSELRTNKACQLLAATDRRVTEICSDVGYVNISNFNRIFRELRGMSPSKYRQLAQT